MTAVRSEPRISVNKLGEYLVASARRRRSIIKAQKHPQDFIVARYLRASDPIIQYLLSDCSNNDPIIKGIRSCKSVIPTSDWDEQDLTLSIEALMAFNKLADKINLADTARERTNLKESANIMIAGVNVSVRPEILIRSTDQKGMEKHGAVKLLFSKTFPLDINSGEFVATVLRQYVESTVGSPVNNARCMVIDVFAQKFYYAPTAYRRRLTEVEAACEEISHSWKAI